MVMEDIQQRMKNVGRIHVEVVQENEGISMLKESKDHMWI
jgi:intracellular sulfur oxidation DsrE/DsrF family protein